LQQKDQRPGKGQQPMNMGAGESSRKVPVAMGPKCVGVNPAKAKNTQSPAIQTKKRVLERTIGSAIVWLPMGMFHCANADATFVTPPFHSI
jgi:hypothetical protein